MLDPNDALYLTGTKLQRLYMLLEAARHAARLAQAAHDDAYQLCEIEDALTDAMSQVRDVEAMTE